MKLNLEFANMANYCVIEEGTLVLESKVNDKKHLYLPNGAKAFDINPGNLMVGRLRSVSPMLKDMGYVVGEFVGYTYIGRMEFKHSLLKEPVIMIPNTSIVGKIEVKTLESIEGNDKEYFYERFFPASENGIGQDDLDKFKGNECEWSGGREAPDGYLGNGKTKLVF